VRESGLDTAELSVTVPRKRRTLRTNREHLAGMNCSGNDVARFLCSNISSIGDTMGKSIEQFGIVVPPLIGSLEVVDMSPVSIVALVRE
jgi:hypothetical protein